MLKGSFVMPTKNRAGVIGEAIESIVNQTETDWELIIVDDNSDSDDNTEEVISEFNSEKIKYFYLPKENGHGIAAARNYGNAKASSDVILVMDSDDVCYDDRLEITLKCFNEKRCDVAYGEIDWWTPETNEIKKRDGEYASRTFSLIDYSKINYIPHPTVAYKRNLAYDFPYNSFFGVAEDYDLLSRLAIYGFSFHFIDQALIKHRRHIESTIAGNRNESEYIEFIHTNRKWN